MYIKCNSWHFDKCKFVKVVQKKIESLIKIKMRNIHYFMEKNRSKKIKPCAMLQRLLKIKKEETKKNNKKNKSNGCFKFRAFCDKRYDTT